MDPTSVGTLTNTAVQFSDSLSPTDVRDVFNFTIGGNGANANISVHALNGDAVNTPALSIFRDMNGNGTFDSADQLVEFDDRGTDHSVNALLASGNYFGVVNRTAFGSTDTSSTPYNITMSATAQSQPSNVIGVKTSFSFREDVGTANFTQHIGAHNTSDFFSVHMGDKRIQTITLDGLTSDADVRVIQDKNHNNIVDAGEEVVRSANGGNRSESITLQSGPSTGPSSNLPRIQDGTDYLIQVYQFGGGETNYHLNFQSVPIIS